MSSRKTGLRVASIVFAIFAIGHLLRLIKHAQSDGRNASRSNVGKRGSIYRLCRTQHLDVATVQGLEAITRHRIAKILIWRRATKCSEPAGGVMLPDHRRGLDLSLSGCHGPPPVGVRIPPGTRLSNRQNHGLHRCHGLGKPETQRESKPLIDTNRHEFMTPNWCTLAPKAFGVPG